MKLIFKRRARATAVVGALAGVLTLSLAGSASASSVPAWQLQVCSWGSFQTNVYYTSGFMAVPAGQCQTMWFQPMSTDTSLEYVTAYVNNGGYIASATVNVATGAGLATGGSASSPYLWSY
ncbi:hypothetical protein [Streptomyces laculatispora]|uniref:hypothetical protein n=1 Tax=Streptomyces laculatispora TaxID=887464 RepID=UPI001A9448A4|nr:hypothetical protein [Streptomyces laculatispora]MBO0913689.1 hypothetical protein [Streptomyces laculatispora]